MVRRVFALFLCLSILTMAGCAGIREAGGHFTVHAESFRIFGYAIPEDDQAKAASMVPDGATIYTCCSTPADWTSVIGVLRNIVGFHGTCIAGTTSQ